VGAKRGIAAPLPWRSVTVAAKTNASDARDAGRIVGRVINDIAAASHFCKD